ncbi:hypothetical protein WJT74_08520 [Sphingomicrobium sp. XHP0239]|uniref:hypothetical protein n=1 Tax=Sphingomicrobium maritimum TaxID=3133972 RepID=UPI0031CCB58B
MKRLLAASIACLLAGGCAPAAEERDDPLNMNGSSPEAPGEEQPRLLLLSSLPILFGPGFPSNEEFFLDGSADGERNLLRESLEEEFDLLGIAATGTSELAEGDLLLMAHARAQTAENLVALDEWVRAGGRVLLLADPGFAIDRGPPTLGGDYPPPFFTDNGLLGHWGLLLDGPVTNGTARRSIGGAEVLTRAPGQFRLVGDNCTLEAEGFIADCSIGAGRALIVADADFIVEPDDAGMANRRALEALLLRLAS